MSETDRAIDYLLEHKHQLRELCDGDEYVLTYLAEASLSRLLNRIKGRAFGIITGFKSKFTSKQNRQRNAELRTDLSGEGLRGFYELIGHWQECPDPDIPYSECPPEEKIDTTELSYMYVKPEGMTDEEFAQKLAAAGGHFEQDAVLVGVPRSDGHDVHLFFNDGSSEKIGSQLSLNKVSQAYSQMRKKPEVPFTFEGHRVPSGSMLSKMGLQRLGYLW